MLISIGGPSGTSTQRSPDMPLTKPSGFRTEVTDIAHQITQLAEGRDDLLRADTMRALDLALEDLEHGVEVLMTSVTTLRYKMGLEMSRRRTATDESGQARPQVRVRNAD